VLCDWLLIDRSRVTAISLTVAVLIVFTLTILYYYRHKKSSHQFEYVTAVTGFTYCVFMIFTSALTRYEQFTSRLLSPMFIPLLWSLSCRIPGFISGNLPFKMVRFYGSFAGWFLNIELRADFEFYDGKDAGIPDTAKIPLCSLR
jgi:hypothetical protein